ncbi:MAG: tetratricopeptide repeat protein [Planctomycetales bacterium]
MSELVKSSDARSVSGQRFALIGKFAGMSQREARKLIRQQGGTVCDKSDPSIHFIVLGEAELPLRDVKGAGDWLSEPLQEAEQNGSLSIIGETELWQLLGLIQAEQEVNIRNLYTSAMVAELLDVPTATVRRWHRRGLISSKVEIRRLAYFDFQEVVNARVLAKMLVDGFSPDRLEKKLQSLARFLPGIERRLAELTVIVEGRDILLRQGDELIDTAGQLRIDFEISAGVDSPPSEDSSTLSVPATWQDAEETAGSAEEMTADEIVEAAALLEDDEQLTEAATLYRTALAAYGPDADIHFRLAELLYRMGDESAARERYYAAIELDEDYVEARANLGCVLFEQGEVELAIAAWEGAIAYHPDYADVHMHLARCLDELKREEEAAEHWNHFLLLAPESPWADEARRRLAGEQEE